MKFNRKARRKAREFAVQALYQWALTGLAATDILLQFVMFDETQRADEAYLRKLFLGAVERSQELDALLTPFLDRGIHEVSPVELSILRLASFELLACPELPYRVILNESIELSKCYGGTDSQKFTNGVLDKLAHQLRAAEVNR